MPRLAVPSRTRAQPLPRSSTLNDDGERSGHSSARRDPNSVMASQTVLGSRSVLTVYVTLATELLLLLGQLLVDRQVGEVVRAAIFLTRHVLDLVRQPVEETHRFRVELLKLGFLDPVPTHDLLDPELGIQVDLDPIRLPLLDRLEALDECVVLGLVVG